jgi:phosphoesterase RecJ-like protein
MDSQSKEILDFLRSDDATLVVTHFFPDGDAIGSLVAFSGMLDQLGVEHIIAVDDACPEKYSFMPGFNRIRNLRRDPETRHFARLVILDAGALPRIGSAQQCIGPETRILNIDHHFSGQPYGHLNLVDVEAAATAEILYRLCVDLGLEIDQQIAYGLFVGILTDTGRFRFANTTSKALAICGELVKRGVDAGWTTENIYYNLPFELVQALARALASIELHFGGLVCLLSLDRSHFVADTEGFVEYASSIKGVALAAFVCEMEERLYKVSLRSRSPVDVSEVARQFGGGGHIKAAGFRFHGEKSQLAALLLAAFQRQIAAHDLRPGGRFIDATVDEGEEIAAWIMEWTNST